MNYKTIPFHLFGGQLDTRSTPDDMVDGSIRWRQNFAAFDNRRTCRREGFEKYLSGADYANQDLHDQLLSLQTYYDDLDPKPANADVVSEYPSASCGAVLQTRNAGREPIELLYDVASTTERRVLFAATATRIYSYSPFYRNWKIIGDGISASQYHWKAANNQDTVVFTNGYSRPVYHQIGQATQGCGMQAVQTIPGLEEAGVTQARLVVGWKGLIIFLNVTQYGVVASNRVVWSDYNNPLDYLPKAGSVAGFQDLGNGEVILNALPLGDVLVIYTDKGIWHVTVTNSTDAPLSFFQAYSAPFGEMCLFYPNAITTDGSVHYYMGQKGINAYSTTLPEPEEIGWIHAGSDIIYDDINEGACEWVIMKHNDLRDEIYLSWPQAGQSLPSRTMAINLKEGQRALDVIDHGFTAMTQHQPEDRMTIGEFILTYGICTEDDLVELAIKQGCGIQSVDPVCEPTSIWNADEDFAEDMDPDSLCDCLGEMDISTLCGGCKAEPIFIAASSTDYCIKTLNVNMSREICSNVADVGAVADNGCYESPAGEYSFAGYYSIIRIGPLHFGKPEIRKLLVRVFIEAYPEIALNPALLLTSVGVSRNAFDPNIMTDRTLPYDSTSNPVGRSCGVQWTQLDDMEFACFEDSTPEELVDDGLDADLPFQWEVYEENKFLYLEIAIANNNAQKTAATSGAGCFSRIEFKLKTKETM